MREDIVVRNFGDEPAFCALELSLDCRLRRPVRGQGGPGRADGRARASRPTARRHDLHATGGAAVPARCTSSTSPSRADARRPTSPPTRSSSRPAGAVVDLPPAHAGHRRRRRRAPLPLRPPVERATPVERLAGVAPHACRPVDSDHETLQRAARRGRPRTSPRCGSSTPSIPTGPWWPPGAPWFMTLFGRDSLLTSWMAMIVDPDLALGTLQTLARFQGTRRQPRAPRRSRAASSTRCASASRPSSRSAAARIYYGSGRRHPAVRHAARRAAAVGQPARARSTRCCPPPTAPWSGSTRYGDRDGDGYVEYQRTTDRGLETRDGRTRSTPSASPTAGWPSRRSRCARCRATSTPPRRPGPLRRPSRATTTLRRASSAPRAADLKAAFNRDFWLEDQRLASPWASTRDKRPVDALTSNMGHCLWTGIVDDDKAPLVAAARCVSDELFSRLGHPHAGHVDDGLQPDQLPQRQRVAARQRDLRRRPDALRLRRGSAPRHARASSTPPPYFGEPAARAVRGLARDEFPVPGELPDVVLAPGVGGRVAAAVPPLDAPLRSRGAERQLHLAPAVPEWIGRLTLRDIPLMGGHLSIEVEGDRSTSEQVPEGLTVVEEPRQATF